jgi:hypothetical protein
MNKTEIFIVSISAILMVFMIWGAYYGYRHRSLPLVIAVILVGLGTSVFGFSFVFFIVSKMDMEASLFTGIMLGVMNAFWFWLFSKTKLVSR